MGSGADRAGSGGRGVLGRGPAGRGGHRPAGRGRPPARRGQLFGRPGTLATARADAEDSGRTDLLLRAEGLRGNLLARLGQSREGIAAVRAALDQALAASQTDTAADLQQRLADSLEHAGDYRAATAVYAAAFQFCEAHGADAVGQLCRARATVVLFTRGEWDRTAACARTCSPRPRRRTRAGRRRHARPGARDAGRGPAGPAAPAGEPPDRHPDRARADGAVLVLGLCVLENSAGSGADAADRARRMLTRLARTQERHFSVLILQWMAAFFAEQGMDADVRACAAAWPGWPRPRPARGDRRARPRAGRDPAGR